jgi:hypothetical protein
MFADIEPRRASVGYDLSLTMSLEKLAAGWSYDAAVSDISCNTTKCRYLAMELFRNY